MMYTTKHYAMIRGSNATARRKGVFLGGVPAVFNSVDVSMRYIMTRSGPKKPMNKHLPQTRDLPYSRMYRGNNK